MSAPALRLASWRALLEQQDGVLARWQALRSGMSEETWTWRLRRGTWQHLLPGVAVAHSGGVSREQRAWAAVLYAGPGAALSGAAIVSLLSGDDGPAALDVAVPAERQRASRDEVTIHRCTGLAALVHPVRSPPQVRPAPAVLHAAAWARTDRAAEVHVASAVQQRLLRPTDLRTALAGMPRLHRRALVATVLDDVELGAHARSELDFLAFLRRHRLPRPDRLQRPVRAGGLRYLDAWWEAPRVGAELDGAHHRIVRQWGADLLRANAVQVAERHDRVVLLRYTPGNLRHDAAQVAAQLTAVLR